MPRTKRATLPADAPANAAFRRRIGRAIRKWRTERAKITREELAYKTGLSLRTLVRLEAGDHDPRASALQAMEQICPGLVRSVFHISGESC